jgi:low affinity Fe/Cu permease
MYRRGSVSNLHKPKSWGKGIETITVGSLFCQAASTVAKLSLFNRLTTWAASAAGSPTASIGAAALVVVWAACGPMFHYSETWQLVINTGTTIVTFLMVFLIQSSQNRDSCAVHLKLDEIISALHGAKDELMDLEGLDQATLDKIRDEYVRRAELARQGHSVKNEDADPTSEPH